MITQVVVIDNWDGPYGYSLAATGSLSSIYYGVLVIFGSFFVSKLVLAVIASKFAEVSQILADERREQHRCLKLLKERKRSLKLSEKARIGLNREGMEFTSGLTQVLSVGVIAPDGQDEAEPQVADYNDQEPEIKRNFLDSMYLPRAAITARNKVEEVLDIQFLDSQSLSIDTNQSDARCQERFC
jgi:hypothetical protein